MQAARGPKVIKAGECRHLIGAVPRGPLPRAPIPMDAARQCIVASPRAAWETEGSQTKGTVSISIDGLVRSVGTNASICPKKIGTRSLALSVSSQGGVGGADGPIKVMAPPLKQRKNIEQDDETETRVGLRVMAVRNPLGFERKRSKTPRGQLPVRLPCT